MSRVRHNDWCLSCQEGVVQEIKPNVFACNRCGNTLEYREPTTSADRTTLRTEFAEEFVGDLKDKVADTFKSLDADLDAAQAEELMVTHSTGAVRSNSVEGFRFDLIPLLPLLAQAANLDEGAIKYGDGNWLKGFKLSELYNHLMMHLVLWLAGDKSEDNLRHAQWNLNALIHFEKLGRVDLDDIQAVRDASGITPDMIQSLKEACRNTVGRKR